MRFTCLSFVAIGIAAAVQCAEARDLDPRHRGRILARQFCGECHAVQAPILSPGNFPAPSFVAIAATPGMTAIAMNSFLNTSHRTMPNIVLTADQRKEIVDYILSLRK